MIGGHRRTGPVIGGNGIGIGAIRHRRAAVVQAIPSERVRAGRATAEGDGSHHVSRGIADLDGDVGRRIGQIEKNIFGVPPVTVASLAKGASMELVATVIDKCRHIRYWPKSTI